MRWLVRSLILLLLVSLCACGPGVVSQEASNAPARPAEIPNATSADNGPTVVAAAPGEQDDVDDDPSGDLGPVPVTRSDPSRGSASALVTIVEFADFQCPFCGKVAPTLEELRRLYGSKRLRVVWKNNPLPFHPEARPAAEAAMTLFQTRGNAAFWAYHDAVFNVGGDQRAPTSDVFENALKQSRLSKQDLQQALRSGEVGRKIDADMELARALGETGTPNFLINGVRLNGAQPADKFREIIDAEASKAESLLNEGLPRRRLYAELTKRNYVPEKAGPPSGSGPTNDEKTVHRVPIGGSPVLGKPTALVTIVLFSDFQCPFCAKVEPTLSALEKEYGDKIRLVWKNQPLAFHNRAEIAAEVALDVRAQKGDAAFWKVHDLLFAQFGKLEDADLVAQATAAGADGQRALRAATAKKHQALVAADQDLAEDLGALGTPACFLNGRMISGAQPIEKFRSIIDEEIVKAQALVKQGTAPSKVYDAIQAKAAQEPEAKKVNVPAPTKDNPSKGPAGAKVVLHAFGDYQCPYTKRVQATLADLMAAFPGQIRLVWHNTPLPFHPQARLAAMAAMEAYRQKGAPGFWKMHELLFEDPSENGLGRQGLTRIATRVGLDLRQFEEALDRARHEQAIKDDEAIASKAGVSGTPGFVINGVLVSGAQPLDKFKKIVRRALASSAKP